MANAFDFLDVAGAGNFSAPAGNAFDHLDAGAGENVFDHLDGEPSSSGGALDYLTGLARSAAEGATFNLADEAAAATGSLFGLGPSLLGTKNYDQILKDVRGDRDKFAAAHPVASTAAELGGAMIAPAGYAKAIMGKGLPSLAKAVGAGIESGFASGAAQGFGAGEGGVQNRLEKAKNVGLAGAAGGMLAPIGGQIARKSINALTPYAQAAVENVFLHPSRTMADAFLSHYTGGLSAFVTGPKRVYDAFARGNQIRQGSGPILGSKLGLGPLSMSIGSAGGEVYSLDLP